MKTIFKIHPIYILVAFICLFTGYFRLFVTTTLIILFHELGHIFMMLYFNVPIDKIIILPFGAITLTNDMVNRKLKQEFLIAIMGPIFQIIYYLIFKNDYLKMIHYPLLIFNLLPIIPLDGSKILNIILNKFICFYKSELISIYISFIFMFLLLFFNFNLITFIILIFLIIETLKRYKNRKYLFNKFLYERNNYNLNLKKRKIVTKKRDMFKDCYHLFFVNNKYYTEKEYIKLQVNT